MRSSPSSSQMNPRQLVLVLLIVASAHYSHRNIHGQAGVPSTCGRGPAVFFILTSSLLGTNTQNRRRQWHPTPVLLPGKYHGRRSLVGCSPWGSQRAAAKPLQSCPTPCDPIDSSPPGSPSLGFSRQEHWSGLPCPPQRKKKLLLPHLEETRKGRRTRDQIANIRWIIEKAREFQKNIYFCFIDYDKAFDCVDHNKMENSSRDGNTRPPDLPHEKPVYRSGSNS